MTSMNLEAIFILPHAGVLPVAGRQFSLIVEVLIGHQETKSAYRYSWPHTENEEQ